MLDSVLKSDCIPVPHFFGTRQPLEGVADHIQLGSVTVATPSYPLIAALKQIHSTQVTVVPPTKTSLVLEPPEGDALLTDHPGTLLVVRTADCVPVLFSGFRTKVVAAIHAGWRGTVAGIVPKTIQEARDRFGVKLDELQVAIGPSIGPCCFEVDEAVLTPLRAGWGYWEDVLSEKREAKANLDLKTLIYRQLRDLNIPEHHISIVDSCTFCRSDLFFSYRREGQVNGTMISGIMLPAK